MIDLFKAGILCIIMLTPTSVWATAPFTVEDTYTEGRGNFLFELTGEKIKDDSLKATKEDAIITLGASEHVNLSLEAPYLLLDPNPLTGEFGSGIGDVRFKLKQQLFENEVKQSMAYKIYIDFPTGNNEKEMGTRNMNYGFAIMDTQECKNNAFHLNAGYEVSGKDVKHWHFAQDYAFIFGFAVEHKFTGSFRLLTEISAEIRKKMDEATDTQTYSRPFTASAGFIYDISKSWYVDLGGRYGLDNDAADHSVFAGTAWRF